MAAIDDLSEPQYMAQSLGWNKRLLLRDRRVVHMDGRPK